MNLWMRLIWFFTFGRFRSRINILDVCSTPFIVLPSDLDLLMHMNNGRYLTLLDIARADLMRRGGILKKIQQQGWFPVVCAETIYFKRALKVFQRFTVESQILGWDEKAFYLRQRFIRHGELKAQAIIQARFFKKIGGSVAPAEIITLDDSVPKDSPVIPQWILDWSNAQIT